MLCKNCQSEIGEDKFCGYCGAQNIPDAVPVQNQIPVQQPSQQYSQVQYIPVPQPVIPKKKKHIGLIIFLVILLALIGAAVWFFGSLLGWLLPRNLGVKYTDADYKSAMNKIGIQVDFEGKTGPALEEYKKTLGNKKLNMNDYNWEFSDYQEKSFTLTPAEATAFLNEVAPGFWWFDNLQVNILPDGTMVGSSTADIARLKTDLYSDISGDIPIPLPDKVNIYGSGVISITDNALVSHPKELDLGTMGLPEKYMTDENVEVISSYLERLYTIIPDLNIHSLKADEDGNFAFEGSVPQKVVITKK